MYRLARRSLPLGKRGFCSAESGATPKRGPLDGTVVLELEGLAAAPFCGMFLADFGADVVRIDKKGQERHFATSTLGRGKRSVELDLKDGADAARFRELAATADVVIEPYRPGVMERLSLGPEELCAANPRLVYARLTGWGQAGPQAHTAGHDINYIAQSGALSLFARPGERPLPPVNLLGDFAGGSMSCAAGILLALLERGSSGRGQVVDAAMIDGAAYLSTFVHKLAGCGLWDGRAGAAGSNLLDTGAHFYDTYEAGCGGFVAVGAIEPQFYALLLRGLGLADDPLFGGGGARRQLDPRSWGPCRAAMAEVFLTRSRDEWSAHFRTAELEDACVSPVLSMAEVGADAHGAQRGLMAKVAGGDEGEREPAPAPRLSRTPALGPRPCPRSGEHTEEVLGQR
jgi:alpha-methylacyl-CoA racemase